MQQRIHYTLRIAVAMCFIGHGAFGIITKPIWCNYFAVFGISHDGAYRLMPFLGSFDILMGIGMLVYPVRAIPLWLVIWGFLTASLRPLSGEPFAELIERAGNFGAPLALLMLSGGVGKNFKDLFTPLPANPEPDPKTMARVLVCLRITCFLLLAGHGWLNIIEKKSLLSQYAALGFSNAGRTAVSVGMGEIIAAFSILIRPFRPLVFILLIWKMGSEFFYPHYELLEWIERGGSYGVLLSLWFALDRQPRISRGKPSTPHSAGQALNPAFRGASPQPRISRGKPSTINLTQVYPKTSSTPPCDPAKHLPLSHRSG